MGLHSRSERLIGAARLGLVAVLVGGCARAVLPSEKAYLADPIMQLGADPIEQAADQHVMSNREGAAGGAESGAGGCGCN